MSCVLVIDLGTQSMRGTLFSQDGEKRWSASFPVDSDIDGDRYEQDPRQWSALLQQILKQCEDNPQAIVATAPLSGLVCMDGKSNVLHPAITYADRRCAAYVDAVAEREDTGMRPYISDPLPKALWLKHERPDVYGNAQCILDATGYLNWLLTGQATMDCYTALRCPRDVAEALGLSADKFGRVTTLGETIGEHDGVPIIAATYDSKCAYVGSGIQQPGEALDISGTVTSIGVVTDHQIVDPQRRIYSVPLHDRWLVRGSTAMSGGVLEWARRQLSIDDFDEFDSLIQQSTPGSRGVTFLPFLAGERAPLWNPHATGAWHGMTLSTGRADMARSICEGLCFSLMHIIEVMEEHGVHIKTIRLAGGLSRNDLLCRIKSDVTGKKLIRLQDAELTSIGAAVIAGVANESMLAVDEAFEPDPANRDIYRRQFATYRDLVTTLLPTFKR